MSARQLLADTLGPLPNVSVVTVPSCSAHVSASGYNTQAATSFDLESVPYYTVSKKILRHVVGRSTETLQILAHDLSAESCLSAAGPVLNCAGLMCRTKSRRPSRASSLLCSAGWLQWPSCYGCAPCSPAHPAPVTASCAAMAGPGPHLTWEPVCSCSPSAAGGYTGATGSPGTASRTWTATGCRTGAASALHVPLRVPPCSWQPS